MYTHTWYIIDINIRLICSNSSFNNIVGNDTTLFYAFNLLYPY